MRYVGTHREVRRSRLPRLRNCVFGALALVACGVAGAALEDSYAPPPVARPPSVRLVPVDPIPDAWPGTPAGAEHGARVGRDLVVRQIADAADGIVP